MIDWDSGDEELESWLEGLFEDESVEAYVLAFQSDWPLPEPPIDWQYLHLGGGCYIEQPNPELKPEVIIW